MRRKTLRILAVTAAVVVAAAATGYAYAGDFTDEPGFDFDCDGQRDPFQANSSAIVDGIDAGAVTVEYSTTGEQAVISQSTPGVSGSPEHEDGFAEAVAGYDENGDGCDDLVVGAPDEDVADADGRERTSAGMVWVIPGSPAGLDGEASRGIHFDTAGIPGSIGGGKQRFGAALAAENSTDEAYLLVGAPGSNGESGAAYFLRGGRAHKITQDSPGVSESSEPGDFFGSVFSVSDRYFAIGVPSETIGDNDQAGMAHVFGLQVVDGTLQQLGAVHQNTAGITGAAESGDGFGNAVSVIAYRATEAGKVAPLLSAGVSGEDIGDSAYGEDAGMAHLISIPSTGNYDQISAVHENTPGVRGEIESMDRFGWTTVLAPEDGSAVGTPYATSWVVGGGFYHRDDENHFAQLHVLSTGGDPVAGSRLIEGDAYGLPFDQPNVSAGVGADPRYLYVGRPGAAVVYGVPWGNIHDGQTEPTVIYRLSS